MLGRLGALFTDSLALLNQPAHFAELDRFARLPQVVLLLHRHPSFGTGIKSSGEPESHCGAHSRSTIEQLGKRLV